MKKKISVFLAALMALSMLAGCKKTDEDAADLPEIGGDTPIVSLTRMTEAESEETTAEKATEATEDEPLPETAGSAESDEETEETTTEATTESSAETSESTATTSSEAATSGTTATVSAAEPKAWNETEISETLYIKTSCYSRTQAIVGSESVKKYSAGQKINIVAATDTGYYKLADGTFIHSDYVTDQKPEEAASAAEKTSKTTKKTEFEIVTEDMGQEDTGSTGSSTGSISSSYNKSYKDRYPYQKLSRTEQKLYANIVEAAENFMPEAAVPEGMSSKDVLKVYALVFNEEPQLFWLPTAAPKALGGVLYINYAITRDEAERMQKKIDANVKSIMSKANNYSSTVSKIKVLYDWVILNNDADVLGSYASCGIYNGLGGGGALQCQGYAKTFQYLCDVAGIESMVVPGNNPEGGTHAWNVVYCDNGYYIVDTTWGDPRGQTYATYDYARYLFFLANDEMTRDTHLNVSTIKSGDGTRIKLFDPPACTKTACYYFKAYNKEYSDLDSAVQGMNAEIDAAVSAHKTVTHIRVTDHKLWETLRDNSYWKKFQDYAKSKDSNVKEIKRQTTYTEGVLVVQYDIVYKK